MTNNINHIKAGFLILALGLSACQTAYDAASEQEERDFCGYIENQNSPRCAGNHTPDIPSS